MIFITVIIALNLEKMVTYILKKVNKKPDGPYLVTEEIKEEQYDPMDHIGPHEDETVRKLKKRIRLKQEEQADLEITIQVRDQALSNLQERRCDEKS